MKIALFQEKSASTPLICKLIGHKFVTTRKITNHINEYECCYCQKEVTNDPKGKRINLTDKQREINETLVSFFQKRHFHTDSLIQNSLR